MNSNGIIGIICFIIAIIVIICIILACCGCFNRFRRPSCNSCSHSCSSPNRLVQIAQPDNKESFLITPNRATVTGTGAIISNGIQTNQMVRGDVNDLANIVNANGFVADGAIDPGVSLGNGFEEAYNNQQAIIDIGDKAQGGYESNEQLKEITQKITATNNNANNNLFTRAGDRPTKLYLAQNEVRCVIDEKYMSERDKNQQVAVVGTVIPTQGYDLNIERIGENLLDTHFSAISCNKNRSRIPTKAGATIESTAKESPNLEALEAGVKILGDALTFNNVGGDDKTVSAAIDPGLVAQPGESFRRRNYV